MMDNVENRAFPNDGKEAEGQGRFDGLTTREYFAAMAMQGILSGESDDADEALIPALKRRAPALKRRAEWATQQADALIAQLAL